MRKRLLKRESKPTLPLNVLHEQINAALEVATTDDLYFSFNTKKQAVNVYAHFTTKKGVLISECSSFLIPATIDVLTHSIELAVHYLKLWYKRNKC